MLKRKLVLENGTVFIGAGFGSDREISGEVVFNTSMTGYQEIISDPSYCEQIVTLTYPLIGNYGINRDDFETVAPFINGLIVKEYSEYPSNFRCDETIDSFLKAHNIPGLAGIDTRKLTKCIRRAGTMRGYIANEEVPDDEIIRRLQQIPVRHDQVKQTSTSKPYIVPGRGRRIVLLDFGMKHGILRELTKRDCHVTVVPYNYSADNILRLKPDGIMLTNGPGDPQDVPEAIETIQRVIGAIPIFGICLGHQLLALACGAKTEKMKFGHRGGNHPVKDIIHGKTFLTSQNHGYAVNTASLANTDLELTQIALNDHSVEGIRHKVFPAFSVQYHPESSPGPEDSNYLFDDFLRLIDQTITKQQEEKVYA
ncbi:glutamine-hydrolyzing carbamoyl-phosphate synthase small subunit [Ornithinibacillus hominis]|uniref:Carbamoyl phosphate synthase small chain n=1 Tax=Ornithinibacillus hominis TaxID=2763055 RepID=A0A923L3N8_9BACI|nr:glutamine-hydrolyzing carbamoyl-phosphate synthase small subunit [Ornithinibacillus hominis]MBC5635895.1 glutamine-hydrolyzing carbamoyl-phosphate synthase small subunit [Ornithinibacillus hominis]